jgi:hypothetical protein
MNRQPSRCADSPEAFFNLVPLTATPTPKAEPAVVNLEGNPQHGREKWFVN